ncbi:MAG: transposase [Actinomycetia bacterium]|nr:transposase [Actinomycetes bacterium]
MDLLGSWRLAFTTMLPEANLLGRTLAEWAEQITNWHLGRYSNGPTEGANNQVKRVKRAGYGIHHHQQFRLRALLYAGNPNWDLLNTITREASPKDVTPGQQPRHALLCLPA